VVGHEPAPGGRDAVEAAPGLGVERAHARDVRIRVARERRPVRGVRVRQRGLDLAGGGDRVAGVVPPVRVVRLVAVVVRVARVLVTVLAREDDRELRAQVDDVRARPALLDDVVDPAVEAEAAAEDDLRLGGVDDVGGPGLVLVRVGVGVQELGDGHGVTAHRPGEVRDDGGGGHDLQAIRARRDPAAARDERGGDRGERRPRGRAPPAQDPSDRGAGERHAAHHGDRRAGRRVGLHRQPQAERPLGRRQQDGGHLPRRDPVDEQPRRHRGDHEQRRGEQGADRRQRRHRGDRHQGEQDGLGQPGAQAECTRRRRVEALGEPAPPEQRRRRHHEHRGAGGDRHVVPADEQQRAEQQRVHVRGRVEDVGGEDHPAREAGHEDERGRRPVLVAAPPHRDRHAAREQRGRAERTERRGEAQAVREHESGKRGRPDRVRVERQAAQHDPGPEQAAGQREEEHLDEPALHERERERLQHETESTSYLWRASCAR